MRRHAIAVALSIAVLALLAADSAVVISRAQQSPATDAFQRRLQVLARRVPAPDPAVLASVNAAVAQAESFVSASRGLRFEHPVTVRLLRSAEFNDLLGADYQPSAAERARGARLFDILRALKLIVGHPDPVRAAQARVETTSGLYSPQLHELFVRGQTINPQVRLVLAHELTHALDDQHFHLRAGPANFDDATFAYAALVEGDAVVVASRFYATLSPADKQAITAIAQAQSPAVRSARAPIPPALLRIQQFPYTSGQSFISALVAAGGEDRIDGAFSSPPKTTAEILYPDRSLAGSRGPHVATPSAGGRVIERGHLGALVTSLALERLMPRQQATAAVSQWAGDAFVAWRHGAMTCVRDRVRSLDGRADGALESALREWSLDESATFQTNGVDGSVTFTICG